MQIIEGELSLLGDEKIAIISSRFNHLITDRLVEGAKDCFLRHGGIEENLTHILVPGAFEIPFALEKVLAQGNYDGVCCLGAIIRGSTPHFDYVSAEATKGIANVTIRYGAAVTFGVLTTDSIEQAIERAGTKAGNKGFESMSSLIELINLYRKIGA
ncbi:6,7-dimethyl-8-ribityllumazine synthase [Helicobacter pullorum]|uniref:6,7-dimethyl-8-ribityllumazine synthase n=2 Tax=Helicobacter pullorum TaxID=35818 RepID=A0A1C0W299_9HELI|nr:6,7-dimethyl-8-ribityllumazine synthase [Helicobacter pullorum]HIS09417.1 6,7-dimethyl-8-ribityllumazine synthase [Candidatus Scatomorpha intestinipullorum]EEQ63598.1 6,7-dimethyl-8-ribityllumazine synthase [Helicobacter pullorum MIT 98-5489]KPH50507.1 6,7-dimethyl-8-ribityllumazine synthase [Helicobacter pullorum]OCR03965.1 6,7-dimethyl-8-ribityllumazine synthase [Helicobacter pullorum]OCR06446.1 6,7-dimethyl-8-ribityllumazine synthase [Helicobacter pullorum]